MGERRLTFKCPVCDYVSVPVNEPILQCLRDCSDRSHPLLAKWKQFWQEPRHMLVSQHFCNTLCQWYYFDQYQKYDVLKSVGPDPANYCVVAEAYHAFKDEHDPIPVDDENRRFIKEFQNAEGVKPLSSLEEIQNMP